EPVRAGIPDGDLAGAVLTARNSADERAVLQRMVLGLHRETLGTRVGRQALGHGPGGQDTVVLQTEIPVQPARVVLLDHERRLPLLARGVPGMTPGPGFAGSVRLGLRDRLRGAVGAPLGPVQLQPVAAALSRSRARVAARALAAVSSGLARALAAAPGLAAA